MYAVANDGMQPAMSAVRVLNDAALNVDEMNENVYDTFVANRVQPPPSLLKKERRRVDG